MLLWFVALLQVAAPPPSDEAVALGVRLARTGGLAAVAPALIEKDLAELAGEDPSLTNAERTQLLEVGRKTAREGLDRLIQALGAGYAQRLSIEDLRLLVAHGESPAAARWRAAEPAAVAEAMATLGALDLKSDAAAAFCRTSGKLCDRK